MRQRVGIARALALDPKVLLLDEPFGMLDGLTRIELQQELLEIWERDHKTVLMVTHDVDEAVFLADKVVLMTNGPAARVGKVIDIDLERPRNREAVLDDPHFYRLRGELLAFLENPDQSQSQAKPEPEYTTA
jgi:ABC-type nitrate/sulfonate/bicarbonate transport system ATPase subunit